MLSILLKMVNFLRNLQSYNTSVREEIIFGALFEDVKEDSD